jgi:predicted O-methyltransferase YrrM
MSSIEHVIRQYERKYGTHPDFVDPRFRALNIGDPVENDVARLLYALTRMAKAHTIVETGTNVGVSTLAFAQALAEDDLTGSQIITYDIEDLGVRQMAARVGLSHKVTFEQRSSLESDLKQRLAKIDILFLDSLHDLVLPEFEYFYPLLRRHSLVIVHDSRLFITKRDQIDAIKSRYKWEEVSTFAGRGVTILAPGSQGLIPTPMQTRYNLVVDTRSETPHWPQEWPLTLPPQDVTIIGPTRPSELENLFDSSLPRQQFFGWRAAFDHAMRQGSRHTLYWHTSLPDPVQHLRDSWQTLAESEEPLDYIAPLNVPEVAWYEGGLELEMVLRHWRRHDIFQIYTQLPKLSPHLFWVNTHLLRQVDGVHPLAENPHWTFAELLARLILANGSYGPIVAEKPIPEAAPGWQHPQPGPEALQLARHFYYRMAPPMRQTLRQQWRRFMSVYYFGDGTGQVAWGDLLNDPAALQAWAGLMLDSFRSGTV